MMMNQLDQSAVPLIKWMEGTYYVLCSCLVFLFGCRGKAYFLNDNMSKYEPKSNNKTPQLSYLLEEKTL